MGLGGSPIERIIGAALDGLATRQQVIADNVANVETPGFKASRVEFEQLLRTALGREPGPRLRSVGHALTADGGSEFGPVIFETSGARGQDGNNVDIDREMVELAETNITYNALVQLTAGRLQLLRTVINDGRR